jgi:hypothetical protein
MRNPTLRQKLAKSSMNRFCCFFTASAQHWWAIAPLDELRLPIFHLTIALLIASMSNFARNGFLR